jgi:hypothetical protein
MRGWRGNKKNRRSLKIRGLMKWITRERPKIDRVACPWLIARFIDEQPEFLFVSPDQVVPQAQATGAIPYDVSGVELTHDGPLCSFDAILKKYEWTEPCLHDLAVIVRGADTPTRLRAGLLPCRSCRTIFGTTTKCCGTDSSCMTRCMPG